MVLHIKHWIILMRKVKKKKGIKVLCQTLQNKCSLTPPPPCSDVYTKNCAMLYLYYRFYHQTFSVTMIEKWLFMLFALVIFLKYITKFSKKTRINLLKKINVNTFDYHKNSKSLKTGFDLVKYQHVRQLSI